MSKDSLAVTASSIWSRLPNEEQYTQQSSRGGRLSPSARSNASTASSASTSHRLQHAAASSGPPPQVQTGVRTSSPRGYHLYTQQNGQAPYLQQQQGGHFTSRDFAPSPRSSASTSGGSFPPTPDSSTSPHDRHAGTKVLPPGPPPPQGAHHLAPSTTTGATAKRFSPHYSSSLGLYPEEPALEASQAQNVASQPAPTPAPATAVSPAPSSQPLLAEVFSGNPRPHYRSTQSTSALAPYQQYRPPAPGGSVSVDTSPYPHYPPPLASPPVHPETPGTAPFTARSYFAAPPPPPGPNSGRARSASIAALDRPSSVMPPSAYGTTSSEAHHYPGMDAYSYGGGMNGSSGADQHGWKPSGDGPGHISASLPTVSAVGSPSRGSALPHPSSSSVARGGGSGGGGSGGAYSPFGWNEDSAPLPTTAPGSGDREGRSRFRDLWGNTSAGGNGAGGAGLSTSAGSTGGIGMSNMSPFSRDGSKLELDSWSGLSGLKNGGGGGGGGPHGRLLREHSLGAVGTGRKRSDAALWGRPTLLREVEDEDGSEEDGDVFHAPTKSGATSRRHSFAAFDPPNRGATTHQIGFHLPPSSTHDAPSSSAGGGGGFGPLMAPVSSSAWNTQHHGGGGGLGSSAINDDDLAADLNSLHLNLEVAAASNEPPRAAARHLHVGSMPANFPPARTSRALEHSRSPPPPREVPIESNAAPAPAHAQPQPQPQGSSPRATAEPFTPSIGSSVGSRFLLQGLQAPTPLPPATTPVVATASPTLGGGPSPHPQQQQQHQPQQPYQPQPGNRYGPYGQFPPPVPPPITTQHQYFTPATAAPSALSPRGPPPRNGPGAFPGGYGNVPPPHLQQHGAAPLPPPVPPPPQPPLSYFNAPPPPPPGMPQLPQVAAPLTAQAQTDMNLGRGVPLHAIPPGAPLCIVGFKAGRKDLFFCEDPNLHLEEGDLVIVEADRGRDVGKFLKSVTVDEVHKFQQHLVELALGQLASGGGGGGGGGNPMAGGMTSPASMGMGHDPSGGGQGGTAQLARMTKECQPKRIFAKAGPADTHALLSKAQDEVKALALVRSKVAQKGLPMEILDAEWQWDRRKLTFYYTAETRVDFRELVRELFRIWKTRVWLCCLDQQQPSFDIQ